jgi:hypothetical protein
MGIWPDFFERKISIFQGPQKKITDGGNTKKNKKAYANAYEYLADSLPASEPMKKKPDEEKFNA